MEFFSTNVWASRQFLQLVMFDKNETELNLAEVGQLCSYNVEFASNGNIGNEWILTSWTECKNFGQRLLLAK